MSLQIEGVVSFVVNLSLRCSAPTTGAASPEHVTVPSFMIIKYVVQGWQGPSSLFTQCIDNCEAPQSLGSPGPYPAERAAPTAEPTWK